MDCVLVRHGIAVERDEWEGYEADRPLTESGAKRVARDGGRVAPTRCAADSCLVESLDSGDRDGDDCAALLRGHAECNSAMHYCRRLRLNRC